MPREAPVLHLLMQKALLGYEGGRWGDEHEIESTPTAMGLNGTGCCMVSQQADADLPGSMLSSCCTSVTETCSAPVHAGTGHLPA